MTNDGYRIRVGPIEPGDGGGFVAMVEELPGCMSDGATEEEALRNARAAIDDWVTRAQALGRTVPQPTQLNLTYA